MTLLSDNIYSTSRYETNVYKHEIGHSEEKWYWEVKIERVGSGYIGIGTYNSLSDQSFGKDVTTWGYRPTGLLKTSSSPSVTSTRSDVGDIIGIALDLDNGTIDYYKNGVLISSSSGINTSLTYYAMIGYTDTTGTLSVSFQFSENKLVYDVPNGYEPYNLLTLKKTLLKSNNKIYSLDVIDTDNLCVGGKATALHSSNRADSAFNGKHTTNYSTWWYSDADSVPSWIQYEFPQKEIINIVDICSYYSTGYEAIKDFKILASNTGVFKGEEVELFSGTHPNETTNGFLVYRFNNLNSYKFYRISVASLHYGNGKNNISIAQIKMRALLENFYQLPSHSKQNFINYGSKSIENFNSIKSSKNYILQDTVSEDTDGLWKQELNRKPLSIKFE